MSKTRPMDDRAAALLADLGTPPFPTDPYPLFHELRTLGPVHHTEGMSYATTYEGCGTVLRSVAFGIALPLVWD